MQTYLDKGVHNSVFENLFVLEMANNHWGSLARGKAIVDQFAEPSRFHDVKVAMKLQFRDVENFIHKDFRGREDIRYIWKTEATKMSDDDFAELVAYIRWSGMVPMATAFDERSVDFCVNLGLGIIKVASSDHNDWPLLEKVASTRLPVIISSGGASEKSLDDVVGFFNRREIPLAVNHCVSLYPSEDSDLELSQIAWLKKRYPNNVIGFSSHEQFSWAPSMFLSYAFGARTWERHVDIDMDGVPVSPYCTLPEQASEWFAAFNKAKEMTGSSFSQRRVVSGDEIRYLDALVRGVYARDAIPAGTEISSSNFESLFYMSVPLQKGQISTREVRNGLRTINDLKPDQALTLDDFDPSQFQGREMRSLIENRGL